MSVTFGLPSVRGAGFIYDNGVYFGSVFQGGCVFDKNIMFGADAGAHRHYCGSRQSERVRASYHHGGNGEGQRRKK